MILITGVEFMFFLIKKKNYDQVGLHVLAVTRIFLDNFMKPILIMDK